MRAIISYRFSYKKKTLHEYLMALRTPSIFILLFSIGFENYCENVLELSIDVLEMLKL